MGCENLSHVRGWSLLHAPKQLRAHAAHGPSAPGAFLFPRGHWSAWVPGIQQHLSLPESAWRHLPHHHCDRPSTRATMREQREHRVMVRSRELSRKMVLASCRTREARVNIDMRNLMGQLHHHILFKVPGPPRHGLDGGFGRDLGWRARMSDLGAIPEQVLLVSAHHGSDCDHALSDFEGCLFVSDLRCRSKPSGKASRPYPPFGSPLWAVRQPSTAQWSHHGGRSYPFWPPALWRCRRPSGPPCSPWRHRSARRTAARRRGGDAAGFPESAIGGVMSAAAPRCQDAFGQAARAHRIRGHEAHRQNQCICPRRQFFEQLGGAYHDDDEGDRGGIMMDSAVRHPVITSGGVGGRVLR